LAEVLEIAGTRERGCAARFASWHARSATESPAARRTDPSPPWQSAHPILTVPVGCIEASSVDVWQVTHPALVASAWAGDWPAIVCEARADFTRSSAISRQPIESAADWADGVTRGSAEKPPTAPKTKPAATIARAPNEAVIEVSSVVRSRPSQNWNRRLAKIETKYLRGA
jgi:hypothetical protein